MHTAVLSADTIAGVSDDGRQEIALDEEEYEDDIGSDLGSNGDEKLQSAVEPTGEVTVTGQSTASPVANGITTPMISRSSIPILDTNNATPPVVSHLGLRL